MNDLDLEARLRNWYAGFTPADSERAVSAVATAVASARARRGVASRLRWLRPAFALGAVAAAVLAIVVVPMWWRPQVTPTSSASASPSPTFTASPQPLVTDNPWTSVVDDAGPIPGGGMWAVSGTSLLVSLDGGVTWTSGSVPGAQAGVNFAPSTTIIDARHAWTLRAGPGSHTGGTNDFVALVTYRTTDGGRTWQSTTIPGNFSGYVFKLMFADAEHGFLATTMTAADEKTTVYRTSDGGATWTAGATAALNPDFSISDATTLWAASYGGGAMCNMCGQPLLQVSRDSGRTWSVAEIAGYAGKLTTGSLGTAGPPQFLDPSTGYIVVHEAPTEATSDGWSSVFRTTDGGRTWSLIARAPYWLDIVSIGDATHWFGLAPTGEAPVLVATSDAGKTWRQVAGDVWGSTILGYWFVDPLHGGIVTGRGLNWELYLTADGGVSWHPADFGAAAPTASP